MLKSRLPRIAPKLEARLQEVVSADAEQIAEGARERVPVETGALRDSIHTEPDDHGVGEWVVAGNTEAFYGHLVEYGTVNTSPHPFLLPAAEQRRERFVARARAALRNL